MAISFDSDFTMTIDGKAVAGKNKLEVLNPATKAKFADAPDCLKEQLDEAVAAARRAFPAWAATPMKERQALVVKLANKLMENVEPLKRLLTTEQGKPHGDAQGEIMGAVMWCNAIAAQELPTIVNEDSDQRRSITRRVPIGVVGAISPWNYPIMLTMWKVSSALCTGNTVVLKPSPFTPLVCLKMGELARDIFPPGVLNVVSGGDSLGPWMTEHTGIDKISFTGSSATGKLVMKSASGSLKRITLELGGNDAAIVMDDVDVQTLAPTLFWSAFTNNAQLCIASKRMYVHEKVYEPLKTAIVDYAKTVKVGDGAEQGTQVGPIQNKLQYERVLNLLDDAKKSGVTFALGGEVDKNAPGYFVPITIVDNPPENSRVVKEEAFGPVLPLLKFKDVDDVVRRANDTPYGLAGSVWTKDEDKGFEIATRLETGTVWVNEAQHITPTAVFGGHKQSGFGVENGEEGLLEYTLAQTISVKRAQAGA